VKRLFALLLLVPASVFAEEWRPNLTLSAAWNSNATNANLASDRIDAVQTQADVIANQRYGLGRNDSLHPGVHLGANWWPRYNDFTIYLGGLRCEWQHKFGLGALAPTLSAEAAGDVIGARDEGRRGTSYGITFGFRKRFSETTRLVLTEELSRRDAHAAAYDQRQAETTIEIGHDVSEVARVTIGGFWRDGDIISYAEPPRPDLLAIARDRELVNTFGRPMIAYTVHAHTIGGRAGLVRAVSESSAVIFGYEYRLTDHDPLRYVNHLVSISLVHQF
jgi:hypothetical protein